MKITRVVLLLALLCLGLAQETEEIVYDEAILEPLPDVPPPPVEEPKPVIIEEPSAPRRQFKLDWATLKQYQIEVLMVSVIFFYLLAYVRGKKANVKLMERFYRKVSGCLEANFAHIGFSKNSGEAPFNGESPS